MRLSTRHGRIASIFTYPLSDGKVTIAIQDYGLGIPEEAHDQMFSKFFRVDNSDRRQIGGTGLGLAIVKEIVEGHSGHISYTSEMGHGTTFRIELDQYEISAWMGKLLFSKMMITWPN